MPVNFYYVYILSNKHRNVLYTGVTNNLQIRVQQHKLGIGGEFTLKYNCYDLMYFEEFPDIRDAIAREKQLKRWRKEWKYELIKKENSDMKDLAADWV